MSASAWKVRKPRLVWFDENARASGRGRRKMQTWTVEGKDVTGKARRLYIKAQDEREAAGKAYEAKGVTAERIYNGEVAPLPQPVPVQQCANCGVTIGALEQPYEYQGAIICAGCASRLAAPASISTEQPAARKNPRLKSCPSCHKPVARKSEKCPYCGMVRPTQSSNARGAERFGGLMVILGFILCISVIGAGGFQRGDDEDGLRKILFITGMVLWLPGIFVYLFGRSNR